MNESMPNPNGQDMVEYNAVMKRLCGDQELFKEFVDIFLQDCPQHVENFSEGIEAKDTEKIRQAIHALKGLASNFGAAEFCRLAQAIEASAAAGELEDCRSRSADLSAILTRLCAELRSYCNG